MGHLITATLLDNLRTSFSGIFQSAFERAESTHAQTCSVISSSDEFETYGFMKQQLKLRLWEGTRDVRGLEEDAYTIVNKLYQESFSIPRTKIEDDKLGMYSSLTVPQLAEAAAKLPDELFAEVIEGTTTAFDGVALFSGSRDYGGGTIDNDFALALTVDNVDTVRSEMAGFRDANGQPLRVNPNAIIVPPALEREAREVAFANLKETGSAGAVIDNVMSGRYQVIVVPELTSVQAWYLADLSRAIKPMIFQQRTSPELVQITQADSDSVFDLDAYRYGVRYRCAMAPSLPHLIARGNALS